MCLAGFTKSQTSVDSRRSRLCTRQIAHDEGKLRSDGSDVVSHFCDGFLKFLTARGLAFLSGSTSLVQQLVQGSAL